MSIDFDSSLRLSTHIGTHGGPSSCSSVACGSYLRCADDDPRCQALRSEFTDVAGPCARRRWSGRDIGDLTPVIFA
jgi:hypothetical protein